MKLSIVTTLYYSEKYIDEFYERILKAVKSITEDYEIIFVNDGSPDNSLNVALNIHNKDHNVKIVDLSRNFGHHKAMMAGLQKANGDLIFLIDSDLEESPELLFDFYKKYQEDPSYDVIYGIQESRKGDLFEKISGNLFYALFNLLSYQQIPKNSSLCRLMTNRYIKSLIEFRENELFMPGIWELTGYKQISIPIIKYHKGKSTYTLKKKISLFVNALTSFSYKPLLIIFYTGFMVFILSLITAVYLIYSKLFLNIRVEGWVSILVSIWLLGGLTIFFMGIIGIYLSKVFIETKNRPYITIKHYYEHL